MTSYANVLFQNQFAIVYPSFLDTRRRLDATSPLQISCRLSFWNALVDQEVLLLNVDVPTAVLQPLFAHSADPSILYSPAQLTTFRKIWHLRLTGTNPSQMTDLERRRRGYVRWETSSKVILFKEGLSTAFLPDLNADEKSEIKFDAKQ
ncbi:hypothetical protein C8R42DRAFT_639558 [Lentinula raphanica]|nr:hypothetical protein C8R42DRAFT_639558 [Lentinula raphanica]